MGEFVTYSKRLEVKKHYDVAQGTVLCVDTEPSPVLLINHGYVYQDGYWIMP